MEFKELTIAELAKGFVKDDEKGGYTCIFCGEFFEEGMVYNSSARLITAERAVEEHVLDCHGGAFGGLMNLDKQISGLSEAQRDILECMYLEKDNKEISTMLGISAATVRTHKFNIQKMKREAKILLALLEQVENEELVNRRKRLEPGAERKEQKQDYSDNRFDGNSLHPFFTQFDLK